LTRLAWLTTGAILAACGQTGGPLPSQATFNTANAATSHQRSLAACTWSTVTTPNKGTVFGDQNVLNAISPRTASDVWSAGWFYDYTKALYHTLAEHWNGTRWKLSTTLDVGTEQSLFTGVAVAGAHDVWAVGYTRPNASGYETLIERWNGHAWSIAQSDSQAGYLNAAAAAGSKDVWAVGTAGVPGSGVLEHWNGTKWIYHTTSAADDFRSVAVIAANDVWAVGDETVGSAFDATLTYHFDGKKWTHIPSPSPLHLHYSDQNWLNVVVPIASNNVWALGVMRNGDYGILDLPLSLHWNGTRWKVVKFPPPGGSKVYNSIWGGTALAAHDLWAVGDVGLVSTQTLAVQWNGNSWMQAPTPPSQYATLQAASPDATGGVWAVGQAQLTKGVTGTLALRCH
jgi:hypothetical protein